MCVNLSVAYYGVVNRVTLPIDDEDEAIRSVYEIIDQHGHVDQLVSITPQNV